MIPDQLLRFMMTLKTIIRTVMVMIAMSQIMHLLVVFYFAAACTIYSSANIVLVKADVVFVSISIIMSL